MADALRRFLNAHRATKNPTHLSLSPNGKYSIPNEELPTLYRLIASAGPSHILETHTDRTAGPVLVDLDFEYPDEPRFHVRQYTTEHVGKFVEAIHDAICHFFGAGCTERVEYVVSEKPTPTIEAGKRVKDGIHILSKGLVLSYADQHKLRLYLLGTHALQNSFNTEHVINTMEEVYDIAVIERNAWYLLGCSKPDRDPYSPTCYYTASDISVRHIAAPGRYSITDLSIRHGGTPQVPLDIHAREWDCIASETKRRAPRKKKETVPINTIALTPVDRDDDSETVRTAVSESISKILKTRDMIWEVLDNKEGYILKHNKLDCLVEPDHVHTSLGHSCIKVKQKYAALSCWSHDERKLPKTTALALWKLLTDGEEEVLIDDLYACREFIKCMGDEIHREGDLVYVFDPVTGMWKSSDVDIIAAVHRHADALIFRQSLGATGSETVYNYGGCTKNIKNMLVHLKALLPDGKYITSNIDATLPYLLFEDGIFHIPTQTFTPGFDKTKVFTARIPRKFPVVRDHAIEDMVNTKLFVQPLQNEGVGKYLKMRLARSLAGCYRDKKFICILGEADCSKGTLTTAMRKAFGDFVAEYNANHLKYNVRSGADEAKKLSWLIPLLSARLAISNEVRMDKVPIDGNLLKSLSSGGDEMGARRNFKDEGSFVPKTSFFFMGNDMPDIAPKDSGIETRLRVVRFDKRFVARPSAANELPADETIKDKLETEEWKNAIFWLVMDAWKLDTVEPPEVCEETREWIPSSSAEFRTILEENFVINISDTTEDNYVCSRDIIAFVKERGLNMSDTKVGRELNKIGLTKVDKKVDGKTVKVWKGIQ